MPGLRFELGNPLGDHVPYFFEGYAAALIRSFDALIDGGQRLSVNLHFVGRGEFQLEVNHAPMLARIGLATQPAPTSTLLNTSFIFAGVHGFGITASKPYRPKSDIAAVPE